MKTVLVYDAPSTERAALADALRSGEVDVVLADTQEAAENAFSHIAVDLVVIGCRVSHPLGTPFLERLRAKHATVRVICVADPGQDYDGLAHAAFRLGIDLLTDGSAPAERVAERVFSLLDVITTSRKSREDLLAGQLEDLKKHYAARIPAKLEALEIAVTRARSDRLALTDARTLAHKLRGSAGTYGYHDIGVAAGRLEDVLVEAGPDPSLYREWEWAAAEEALREAKRHWVDPNETTNHAPPRPLLSQKALLVVAEDQEFLRLARKVGRKLYLNVVTAQSEKDALRRARATALLGAVLDLDPKQGAGVRLARALRSIEANAEVPLAFASRDHRLEARLAAIEAGAAWFYELPMTEDTFTALAQHFSLRTEGRAGRVLIVDGDEALGREFSEHLRSMDVVAVSMISAERIVEALQEVQPDVLLLDLHLPKISGLDVCRALRRSGNFELMPVLCLTAQGDPATRLLAFRAGASDVITKPVVPEELLARVGVQLERIRLLRDRADKDSLSGLMLRRAFIDAFEKVLARSEREVRSVALALLDLDGVKAINDTYGHVVGDHVIAKLGQLLQRRFRLDDLRGRWGGEEFILAFPGETAEFAERATERLLQEFAGIPFTSPRGETFVATFTAGVAQYPDDGTTLAALIAAVDAKLDAGKRRARSVIPAVEGRRSIYGLRAVGGATNWKEEP